MLRTPRNTSGDYRHRITWQSPTLATDSVSGEVSASGWSDEGSQWASIRRLSARESQYAEQSVGVVTHEIACRTVDVPSGADGSWRILGPGGELYSLTADPNDELERNMRTVVMVRRVADGSAARPQGGAS